MNRSYFSSSIPAFLSASTDEIIGVLATRHSHSLDHLQKNAWITQVAQLKEALGQFGSGHIFLEYAIPRMGKRADAVLLLGATIYVLEFKVGAATYDRSGIDQVVDYALDLKNFHSGSHRLPIVPILVATEAPEVHDSVVWDADGIAAPLRANSQTLSAVLDRCQTRVAEPTDAASWLSAPYKPTPTIVEAARALYEGHRVEDISRSDAGAINLTRTADSISSAIEHAKSNNRKAICLVTGVPGSGKTLAGLNLATPRMHADADEHAVFLSGNGPLVTVLREALTRDEVARAKLQGRRLTKKDASRRTHAFIQNIHHFRDDSLATNTAPAERVVVFDEAQRAWTQTQASRFMREKRQQADFDMSEPEFLLSVMDRHPDWCLVVCLIGGGQEINTGEAGLSEWFAALRKRFRHWRVLYSDRITDPEYSWGEETQKPLSALGAESDSSLHLAVNVRSFRAERVSDFVGAVIRGDVDDASQVAGQLDNYPIRITRDLNRARRWLREQARGTERFGLVASSNALRLKADGLHVKSAIDPANWFLNGKDDVRASYALEDVATEFDIQGLELDWVGVCWDANLRYSNGEWGFHYFRGNRWEAMNDATRRLYLANSYRVLLTRARQGMVIFIPEGDSKDASRRPAYYDGTFDFLSDCGLKPLD